MVSDVLQEAALEAFGKSGGLKQYRGTGSPAIPSIFGGFWRWTKSWLLQALCLDFLWLGWISVGFVGLIALLGRSSGCSRARNCTWNNALKMSGVHKIPLCGWLYYDPNLSIIIQYGYHHLIANGIIQIPLSISIIQIPLLSIYDPNLSNIFGLSSNPIANVRPRKPWARLSANPLRKFGMCWKNGSGVPTFDPWPIPDLGMSENGVYPQL